jgi:hypothetical protein
MISIQDSEQKLQESYSLVNLFNNDKIKTVEQALQDQTTPSLAKLKNSSKEKTLSLLEGFILSIKDFKASKQEISDAQITNMARLILNEYYYLKISEIRIIHDKIILESEQTYSQNLLEKIMNNFRIYANNRMQVAKQTKRPVRVHKDIEHKIININKTQKS